MCVLKSSKNYASERPAVGCSDWLGVGRRQTKKRSFLRRELFLRQNSVCFESCEASQLVFYRSGGGSSRRLRCLLLLMMLDFAGRRCAWSRLYEFRATLAPVLRNKEGYCNDVRNDRLRVVLDGIAISTVKRCRSECNQQNG